MTHRAIALFGISIVGCTADGSGEASTAAATTTGSVETSISPTTSTVGETTVPDPSTTGVDTTGTSGTDDGPPAPQCRTYATEYTFSSSLGASYDYSCTHAETARGFELACEQAGAIDTRYWATTADFVAEARLVGLQYSRRFARDLTGNGSEDTVFTFEYDDTGRLERTLLDGEVSTTYDEWDDELRPTHGVRAGQCAGTMLISTYDDAVRTWREDDVGGPAACAYSIERTFDENMIVSDAAYPDGVTATYTTHATATVCL